jgi:hypothetical protein
MRRTAIAAGLIVLLCLGLGLSAFAWVSRAVAHVEPSVICMSQRARTQLTTGTFDAAHQDMIVIKTINFQAGVPRGHLWWHVRGEMIRLTYLAFWSRTDRATIFHRLAPRLKACPSNVGFSGER